MIQKVSIAQVTIGQRHRKDMGDLHALGDSINTLGLLQPVGVTSKMQLVWGERRLKACEMLGWREIDAVVDPSLDDILRAMKAEEDENVCRKPFTHTEAVAIADHIDTIERQRAEERKRDGQRKGGKARHGQLGEESAPRRPAPQPGKTRERVAAAVGMSHDTLAKARKVVAEGAPELVEAMDRGAVSVSAAAEVAALPAEKQREAVAGGKESMSAAAAQVRRERHQQYEVQRAKEDPCDVVAGRWIKSIHDALVPVNSVRRDMGGGKEWARTWDTKNLSKMANELRFVIGQYQQWLTEIQEVLDEAGQ